MTDIYNFDIAVEQWGRIPVDDFEYLSPLEILQLSPLQLTKLVNLAANFRYHPQQWRNVNNSMIDFMQLSRWQGKRVMDFGSGLGLDASLFLGQGAEVYLADINPESLMVARQVGILRTGKLAARLCLVTNQPPYFHSPKLDLFWSMGVLHHFPYAQSILQQVCQNLNPEGECRILLYSDVRWKQMTATEPPEVDTHLHPSFASFTRQCDTVGFYADWYNEAKLKKMVQDFAQVVECIYLCNQQMIGAVIKPLVK